MKRKERTAARGLLALMAAGVVLAACTGGGAATTTTTTQQPPPTSTSQALTTTTTEAPPVTAPVLDLTEQMVIFGAVPPQPPQEVGNIYFPDGSTDFWELFSDDAPWQEAQSNLGAFKIHSWMARVFFSDDELRTLIDYLDSHGIPLMVEAEPLDPPTTCQHTESFEGPYELQMARRVKKLGGTIAAVAIEQPYTYGHKNDGAGSCQYTVERVVDEVVAWVNNLREIYPDVAVGSIEGVWQSPATTPEDMAIWLDAYEAASGEPFAFLHMDVDWSRPDWPEVVRGIEDVADARGVPFGILYNGGTADDSDAWIQEAIERVAEYEQVAGGTPDHVVFQSWTDKPDTVLPETSTSAFTHLINRYVGTRTAMTDPVIVETDGQPAIAGTVTDAAGGAGLADLPVEVWATPLTGLTQDVTITGVVPEGVTEALMLVRVNVEDAGDGTLDAEVFDVSYSEVGDGTNLVPNGDFSRGGRAWEVYNATGEARFGVGPDGDPAMLLVADDGETIQVDGDRFPTTPGATYELTVRMRSQWNPETSNPGYVGIAFFDDGTEVERPNVRLEPVPFQVGVTATDETGGYSIALEGAEAGSSYLITVHTPGDLKTWPSSVTTIVGPSPD